MTNATTLDHYHRRMRRVLDHIDRHLEEDLDLETLSDVAAFSSHHFQRQFSAFFGVSPHRYVQLARMKRAAHRLAFRADVPVTTIALDAGYAAPEAFARIFRERLGQTPSDFRKTPTWANWQTIFRPLDHARNQLMDAFSPDAVTIRELPPTPVAVMEHRGDPATIGATIRRFIAFRKAYGLSPKDHATYTVFHTDPRTTPAEAFRMDLCVATDRIIESDAHDIRASLIPAGRCAVLRVTGASDDLEPAALFLYRDWLPASGEETRDFPLYAQRIRFFPDVPEYEAVTDLFLPLR